MDPLQVTALTTAFDPDALVTTFISMGGFILLIAGIVAAIQLVKWGVRTVRRKVSGGAA